MPGNFRYSIIYECGMVKEKGKNLSFDEAWEFVSKARKAHGEKVIYKICRKDIVSSNFSRDISKMS